MRDLVFIFLVLFSCNSPNDQGLKNGHINSDVSYIEKSKCWVSSAYIECMKDNLPCHCIDQVDIEFNLLRFHNSRQKVEAYDNNGEINELVVDSGNGNLYEVRATLDGPLLFMLAIENDTLSLLIGDKTIKYITHPTLDRWHTHQNLLGKLNLELTMNDADSLKFIKTSELTSLDCNRELGNINLVSTSGNCRNMQILERKSRSLLVYDYLNSCEGKSYPPKLNKMLTAVIDR